MKKFNITQYASLAVVFILDSLSVDADIVYTDIDPDVVIDSDLELLYLDIDANGIDDFYFVKAYTTFTTYTYYGGPGWIYTRKVQWIGPKVDGNSIAGSYEFFSGSYGASFSRFYPFALEYGDKIPLHLSFQNWGAQRIAFKTYVNHGNPWDEGGNWFPEMLDHYIGIKFIGSEDSIHYGWIRCSLLDSSKTLIVKDYAYQTEPDSSMFIGVLPELQTPASPVIYSYGSTIYIVGLDTVSSAEICVYDISGQLIYSTEISEANATFDINCPMGTYIVKVRQSDLALSAKIILN